MTGPPGAVLTTPGTSATMPAFEQGPVMRRSGWNSWAPWCAVLLLALLGLSLLHAVSPHSGGQSDCATCKAVSSPLITHRCDALVAPLDSTSSLDPRPVDRAHSVDARRLSSLRGPPLA